MTGLAAVIVLALVLQDDQFGFLALLLDFGDHGCTLNIRIANDGLLAADEENLVKRHVFAGFCVEFLDEDLVTDLDFDLLATGFYDSVHVSSSFFVLMTRSRRPKELTLC